MHDTFTTLILGIGNPLRGDDGVGGAIVERLAVLNRPDIATRSLHQLLPELAGEIQGYARVVFVDACQDLPPGQWEVAPIGSQTKVLATTHHLEPASLLALAEQLFGSTPPAWCLRVGGSRFAFEQHLAPEVAAVIDACVQSLAALADSSLSHWERVRANSEAGCGANPPPGPLPAGEGACHA